MAGLKTFEEIRREAAQAFNVPTPEDFQAIIGERSEARGTEPGGKGQTLADKFRNVPKKFSEVPGKFQEAGKRLRGIFGAAESAPSSTKGGGGGIKGKVKKVAKKALSAAKKVFGGG